MQEIELRHDMTALKIFVNGKPDLSQAPQEALDIAIAALEPVLSEHFEQYLRRKARERPLGH